MPPAARQRDRRGTVSNRSGLVAGSGEQPEQIAGGKSGRGQNIVSGRGELRDVGIAGHGGN